MSLATPGSAELLCRRVALTAVRALVDDKYISKLVVDLVRHAVILLVVHKAACISHGFKSAYAFFEAVSRGQVSEMSPDYP